MVSGKGANRDAYVNVRTLDQGAVHMYEGTRKRVIFCWAAVHRDASGRLPSRQRAQLDIARRVAVGARTAIVCAPNGSARNWRPMAATCTQPIACHGTAPSPRVHAPRVALCLWYTRGYQTRVWQYTAPKGSTASHTTTICASSPRPAAAHTNTHTHAIASFAQCAHAAKLEYFTPTS